MSAYLIVDISAIHDEQTYARYRQQVSPGLSAAGGEYLARGSEIDVLEGDWRPSRIVVVRFGSMQAAKQWWASPQYAQIRQMRQASTRTNMILVNGCAGGDPP
jgi:uncharacterized protein (DUF1330 family)